MSLILGLDADSKKIGYAYFKDNKLTRYGVLHSFDIDIQGRQFELFSKLYELFVQYKPDYVVIENSIFISNFKTSQAIAEVIGAAKIVCQLFNVQFSTVAVTQWKKAVCNKGNANKAEVAAYVVNKYPEVATELQDVKDAIAICLYGIKKNESELDVEKYSRTKTSRPVGNDAPGDNSSSKKAGR